MITTLKVIDAVNTLILEKYPAAAFYIQNIPQKFQRPSFFIEVVNDGSSGVNHSTTDEAISLQIVYFAPVDDHRIANAVHQLTVSEEVKAIFKKGHIHVEDRAVKVSEISGGPRDNDVYLSVSFQYHESRPMDQEDYALMGEINIR